MRATARRRATVVLTLGAVALGCRSYRGAPASAPGAASEVIRPSGLGTRTFFKLGNGLSVLLEENHAAPVVAVHASVAAGAIHDPAGQEGLAHLVQQVLASSPRGRSPGQVARDFAAIGGRMGAWTAHDQTVFHAVVGAPFADFAVATLGEVLRQPEFTPATVDAARRAAREAARQSASRPDRVDVDSALAVAFAGHPYARSVVGTEATLAAAGPAEASAFYQRRYGPATTTLVLVGDFDPAVVRARVDQAFASWRAGAEPDDAAAPASDSAPRIAVVAGDVTTPHLAIGYRVPGARDGTAPALELLAAVLGSGRGGRLEVELERNRQLATGAHARLVSARSGGLLLGVATLGPGRIDDAARVMLDEFLRLGGERLSADELERSRTFVEAETAAEKAGLDGYARKLALSVAIAGEPSFESAYLDRLRALDADELMQVAAATFRNSQLVVVVVVPPQRGPERDPAGARALADRLRTVAEATATRATRPVADGPVSATGRDVVDFAFPSGVRLLVMRDDSAAQVSVRGVWSGGVRFEDGRLAGATSMLARLLPRETKTRNAQRLEAELRELGGHLDGLASVDSLGLRGDFLATRWERGLELVVDCLRNPKLSDEEVERERRVLLDAIRARDDDPTTVAQSLFQSALYGRHPYRFEVLGTPESVAGLTRRRLLDHFRRWYTPRGLTLSVVGPVDPERVAAKAQSLFADVAAPTTATVPAREVPPSASTPARNEPVQVFQSIARPQARVVIGYPGLTLNDQDRFALEVVAEILGGPEGRLAALRERTAGLEAVSASAREGVEPGYLAVTLAVRPPELEAVVLAVRAELARLLEAGVTDAEVVRARRYLTGARAVMLERRGSVALALALHGAFGAAGRSYRREVDELARVSSADVMRVARRIIDPRRELVAVVRPRELARPAGVAPTSTPDPRSPTGAKAP